MIPATEEASFSHQGSYYLVETRARVIIFDIAAFETDSPLDRRSSSLLSRAMDHPHSGLSSNQAGPPLSLSYPTIVPHHGRPLVSDKSEGAATAKKDHEVREFKPNVAKAPLQATERREHHGDDSSDDSAAEEDIVRIDSPSTLSFPQS